MIRNAYVLTVFIAGCAASACDGLPTESAEPIESQSASLLKDVPYCPSGSCLQAKDSMKPGAAIFNNKAYFTFVGTNQHVGVVIENNVNGSGQNATSYFLADTSADGAALIVYNNVLHMAYLGTNHDLYMRRSLNGADWDTATRLTQNGNLNFIPSLNVSAENVLRIFATYCVNCGGGGSIIQYDVSSTYGVTPTATFVTLMEATNLPVASTTWNGQIFLSWTGTDGNRPIYIKHWSPSTGWSTATIVAGNFGLPALLPMAFNLRLVYRGNTSAVYWTDTSDGTSFGAVKQLPEVTNLPVAPFLAGSTPWFFYIGTNRSLYTATAL